MAIVSQTSGISQADFARARPGRTLPDPSDCLKIQCGAMTQAQAGPDLLADCAFAGQSGVRSCVDPLCVGGYRPSYCVAPVAGPSTLTPPSASAPGAPNGVFLPGAMGTELTPILCRGDRPNDYMAGLSTWFEGIWPIAQKALLIADLPIMETLGFLTPLLAGLTGLAVWGASKLDIDESEPELYELDEDEEE